MRAAKRSEGAPDIEALVLARPVVVCCGPGGVGKTTTAAALGAAAARELDLRVLVLTVDPARRLANALGLERLGNKEVRILPSAWEGAGVRPAGELWAAMLDTKQSWDDLIHRHAPDAATRDKILANALYQNISGRFVQSHDYVAMERLHEIHASGRYDLLIVDTPPTRNALDFLDAPDRMADFFSSRLLRWLTVPARSRVLNFATRPFYLLTDRLLGTQFLEDIAEFFLLFQSMYGGFVERSRAVQRLIAGPETTFLVVTTPELAPAREASFFLTELHKRHHHVGAVVVNKALPEFLLDRTALALARSISRPGGDAAVVSALGEYPELAEVPAGELAEVVGVVAATFERYEVVARREAEELTELASGADSLITVPLFLHAPTDLAGLLELGRRVWGEG